MNPRLIHFWKSLHFLWSPTEMIGESRADADIIRTENFGFPFSFFIHRSALSLCYRSTYKVSNPMHFIMLVCLFSRRHLEQWRQSPSCSLFQLTNLTVLFLFATYLMTDWLIVIGWDFQKDFCFRLCWHMYSHFEDIYASEKETKVKQIHCYR